MLPRVSSASVRRLVLAVVFCQITTSWAIYNYLDFNVLPIFSKTQETVPIKESDTSYYLPKAR